MTYFGLPLAVMAGLVPVIHVAPPYPVDMDARNKSGHDDRGCRLAGWDVRIPGRNSGKSGHDEGRAAVPTRVSGAGR